MLATGICLSLSICRHVTYYLTLRNQLGEACAQSHRMHLGVQIHLPYRFLILASTTVQSKVEQRVLFDPGKQCMYALLSHMSATFYRHKHDIKLQLEAHIFSAACMLVFALGLRVLPAQRALRAFWALLVSGCYLYVQPFIYATNTQPQSIGIASIAMMVSWTVLDWGLLQQPASRPTPREVYNSVLSHVLFGVIKVQKRRSTAQHSGAPATVGITCAEESPLRKKLSKDVKMQVERVLHVYATDSPGPPPPGSSEDYDENHTAVEAAHHTNLESCRDVSTAHLMLNADFDESTSLLTSALMANLSSLTSAWLVLLRLVVTYDVGFAVLCCISGNMWKQTYSEGDSQGLLGVMLGPKLAYYAFHYAVSFLLPLQMGIGYVMLKIAIIVFGNQQLADSLPAEAFNSPVSSSSISDLWGNRWHQFLRYYFQGLGYTLVDKTIWPLFSLIVPARWQKSCLSTARGLVVFAMSGLWHEYITWAAYGVVTGNYMSFFMLHGIAVVAEGYAVKLIPEEVQARIPYWMKRVYATMFMVLTSPLFTVPYQQHGYLQNCFHPFLVPVTATAARWAGFCEC